MASPWKFLARLVSPRRQQKKDDRSFKDVTPDVPAIVGPTDAPVIESLHIADQPVLEQSQPAERADADLPEPEQSDQSRGSVQDFANSGSGKRGAAPDPVSSDGDIAASRLEGAAESAPAKRETRTRKNVLAAASEVSPVVPSVSDGMVNLDEEIALLRTQLAGKLRLQNAQLKKMLARFER